MALALRQNRIGEIQRPSRITDLVRGHVEEQTGLDTSGRFFQTSAPLAKETPIRSESHNIMCRTEVGLKARRFWDWAHV